MDQANNPLNDDHCRCLDAVLASCPAFMEIASACQEAGLNVGELIEQCKQNEHTARVLKQRFFPHRP